MQILGDRGGGDGRSGGSEWSNEANYERWALCKNKGNIMMMIRMMVIMVIIAVVLIKWSSYER